MRRKTTNGKAKPAHQTASFRSASLLGAILGVLLLVPSVIILPL